MSSLQVKVMVIDEVLPHPNADRLSILVIGGHRTCSAQQHSPGDIVIYVPPDAMVPLDVAEAWGVADYLGSYGRVKTVRLRGVVSRGFAIPYDGPQPVGYEVCCDFGITKYEPPQPVSKDLEPEVTGFTRYTRIERIQNYPDVFVGGEPVVITEKLHGNNSRIGLVLVDGVSTLVCGTRKSQVRLDAVRNKYTTPTGNLGIDDLLRHVRWNYQATSVVLFGEIFGLGVHKHFTYGCKPGSHSYRAFDLAIDGEYVDWDLFEGLCRRHTVRTVPVLYRGPFFMARMETDSDGPTTLGGDHVREGVVIKPVREREDPELGRVVLKRIGDSYEVGQYEWTDSH